MPPCCPTNDRARSAARQGGVPEAAAVVVLVVAVVVVVALVLDGACVVVALVVLGAAAEVVLWVDEVVPLPALPHAARRGASATTSANRLITLCSGMVSSAPSPCTSPAGACDYPDRDYGP
jgi:hypothetical protein